MKIYSGTRNQEGFINVVTWDHLQVMPHKLDPRLDLRRFTPKFDWGQRSLGSAQLAVSILGDMYGDQFAVQRYTDFYKDVIIRLCVPLKAWSLTEESIEIWKETGFYEFPY